MGLHTYRDHIENLRFFLKNAFLIAFKKKSNENNFYSARSH